MIELTPSELKLIQVLRQVKQDYFQEHNVLLRYMPVDFEGEFIQQILPGQPQSVLQLRYSMKKLLDDFQTLDLSNSFFTITYEPHALKLFKH